MVFKILKASGSSIRSVNYNENKVLAEDAEIMLWENFPSNSFYSIYSTLEKYENNPAVSARTRSYSFHATLCPGPADGTTEEESLELIKKVMAELGYGRQPYAVYRHHDIDRIHYHIVSVRVDEKGRAIDRHKDAYRAKEIMLAHENEFHYTLGKDETSLAHMFDSGSVYKTFDYTKGNMLAQMKSILMQSLKYNYTTFRQFQYIMRTKGVGVDVVQRRTGGNRLVFQGLDEKGKIMTRLVMENDLGVNAYEQYEELLEENYEAAAMFGRDAMRIAATSAFLLKKSSSETEYLRLMKNKGIKVEIIHQDDDTKRRVTTATFVDDKSKTCWKMDELGDMCSLNDFNSAISSGHWGADRNVRKTLSRQDEGEYKSFLSEVMDRRLEHFLNDTKTLEQDIDEEYGYGYEW